MATEFWRQGKFSDRNNKIDFKDYYQTNKISDTYFSSLNEKLKNKEQENLNILVKNIYMYIFGITGNTTLNFLIPSQYSTIPETTFNNTILSYFLQIYGQDRVNKLMDTIETWLELNLISISEINSLFEYFLIQYKCLENKQIISMYSEEEINLINETLSENNDENEKEYIEKATEHLFSKNSKNYNESVSEICKAIEYTLQRILGEDKGTFGQLLNKLQNKKPEIKTHNAFKEAMKTLYGWASDRGSRHATQLFPNGASKEEAELFYFWGLAFIRYIKKISDVNI